MAFSRCLPYDSKDIQYKMNTFFLLELYFMVGEQCCLCLFVCVCVCCGCCCYCYCPEGMVRWWQIIKIVQKFTSDFFLVTFDSCHRERLERPTRAQRIHFCRQWNASHYWWNGYLNRHERYIDFLVKWQTTTTIGLSNDYEIFVNNLSNHAIHLFKRPSNPFVGPSADLPTNRSINWWCCV